MTRLGVRVVWAWLGAAHLVCSGLPACHGVLRASRAGLGTQRQSSPVLNRTGGSKNGENRMVSRWAAYSREPSRIVGTLSDPGLVPRELRKAF